MDGVLTLIIVIGAVISIINAFKKKNQRDEKSDNNNEANNRQTVNTDDISQFFGYNKALNFFEKQFQQETEQDIEVKDMGFQDEEALPSLEGTSLENQEMTFSVPPVNSIKTEPIKEWSSPVYVYDSNAYKEHDYDAALNETAGKSTFLNLFSTKDEITRAVIYSEILRPKFKRS